MKAKHILLAASCVLFISAVHAADNPSTDSGQKKPNILVIWGDDIGIWNISYNSKGMMGYQTPNIDRIAKEGLAFTDYYGQQSCTAHNANIYNDWFLDRAFVIVPLQGLAAKFLKTMQDYPPSQSPGSFNLTKIEEQRKKSTGSN